MSPKAIDRQGRILGRLHVFDALVLCIIGLFFLLIAKQLLQKTSWITVEVKITPSEWWRDDQQPPPNWLALSVQKGSRELDWGGATTAEVMDKKIYDPGWDRKIVYLTLKLRTYYDKKTNQHSYKNQVVEIGNSLNLSLNKTSIDAVVVDVEGAGYQKEFITKIVTVKLYNRFPWYADAIRVGDVMKTGDQIIAEVLDKQVTYSEKTVITTQKSYASAKGGFIEIQKEDPLKRDITVRLRLLLTKDDEENLIFRDDQRIKVGNELWVGLSWVTLTEVLITNIE